MSTENPERISEIVREINEAHQADAPAEEIFALIKKFYTANKYRREVQDVAILTLIAERETLKSQGLAAK
jgi:hypothetical protein